MKKKLFPIFTFFFKNSIEFIFLGNILCVSLCLITFSPRLLFFEGRLYSEKFLYLGRETCFPLISIAHL
jgi:hypothetical protein